MPEEDPFRGSRWFTLAEWQRGSSRPAKLPPLELVWRLEALRNRIGRPLPIVSGYRNPTHNRAVGGARFSRHLVGDAVDIPAGLVQVHEAVGVGFHGIGVRGGWVVHMDTRPGRLVIWDYIGKRSVTRR